MRRTLGVIAVMVALFGAGVFVWAQRPDDRPPPSGGSRIRKPQMADTVKANMYADNSLATSRGTNQQQDFLQRRICHQAKAEPFLKRKN